MSRRWAISNVVGKSEGINAILTGPGLSLLQQLLPNLHSAATLVWREVAHDRERARG